MGGVEEVTLTAFLLAFAAGAASFLSPCVLPLLPGYLSFVSGVGLDELQADTRRVFISTLSFVLGFSLVFTLSGAGAGFIGSLLLTNRRFLTIIGGVLMVLMGLYVAGAGGRFFQRERRVLPFKPPQGVLGAGLVGVAFAIGWVPCVGPILGSILTLAASGQNPAGGALLLFVYSLGLGIPFLLSGLFLTRALSAVSWIKRHFTAVKFASGGLLIVYGMLMITGGFTELARFLAPYQLFEF